MGMVAISFLATYMHACT